MARSRSRSCPKGYIRRSGYFRKSKSGKRTYVKSACIKNRGKPGKGPNLIGKLRKGELKQFGYSTDDSAASRRKSLAKAVKKYGALDVFRKLNAVYVLNKNTNPSDAMKFMADRNWVRKHYAGDFKTSRSRRRSKSRSRRKSKSRSRSRRRSGRR